MSLPVNLSEVIKYLHLIPEWRYKAWFNFNRKLFFRHLHQLSQGGKHIHRRKAVIRQVADQLKGLESVEPPGKMAVKVGFIAAVRHEPRPHLAEAALAQEQLQRRVNVSGMRQYCLRAHIAAG